ncbi:MAG: hypothetical protein AVDCRST_MAG61-918 [uncultured Friedmanniella sp.]|uniref:CHAD domain-containing protein n=1 Tax=uncultured Friedmanniella sp. TaxID=335381 RepID=A0A6J4K8C1_9ACTN|nr:hypothetical protein [uncultured Friedmanniella sp.]CAA9298232.1 MAG: hypothetical protein AVDCRST_MAG61-918 [uncultured Friedmanniella sp.]
MSPRKGSKGGKGSRKRSAPTEQPETPQPTEPTELHALLADAAAPRPSGRPRPPGQRLYDMPYSAVAPRLVNPALGLHNLVARAGHNAAYTIDVTLLDAPDHRLIRSGVLLAHRVLDGRGEWFLTAPDWQPLLPKDRIELMGHSDLPEELADLIRPLRRRAPLGPVAAMSCDRREFALRDDAGTTLALLRDDRVTVRRGGLTTARYREVMITPVGPGLTEEQGAWLDRALTGVGSTLVQRFPRLVSRLGAPATGPTDIPQLVDVDREASFKKFFGQLVGRRLRQLVEADLAVRGGDLAAGEVLADQARRMATELEGLGVAVEAEWLSDLADELAWLVAEDPEPTERLASRLRSERYVALLDLLVTAARSPRLGDRGTVPAAEELDRLLQVALDQLSAVVEGADVDSPAASWEQVRRSLRRVEAVVALASPVLTDVAGEVERRLRKPRSRIDALCEEPLEEDAALASVGSADPITAFAAGRAWERRVAEVRQARQAFLDDWRRAARKLERVRSAQ